MNKKKVIEDYVDAYNRFDVPGMLKGLDEAVIFENYSGAELTHKTEGISAFEQQAQTALSYFTAREQKIKGVFVQDNTAIVQIAYKATLAIDFPNGMKAGEMLEMDGRSEFQFKEGKIIKIIDRA